MNEKNQVDIEDEEEEKNMVNDDYNMVNVDLNFYDPNEK